jgi:predicted DNA-binding transcriptional regulator AlpA
MGEGERKNGADGRIALPPPYMADVRRRLEALRNELDMILAQMDGSPAPMEDTMTNDRMLTVEQVAERLSLTPGNVYRKSRAWPFRVKLSSRVLRFSERGLEAWLKENGRNGKSGHNEIDDEDDEPAVGDVLVFPHREPVAPAFHPNRTGDAP